VDGLDREDIQESPAGRPRGGGPHA